MGRHQKQGNGGPAYWTHLVGCHILPTFAQWNDLGFYTKLMLLWMYGRYIYITFIMYIK
jgi:hypothetical protein